jgi:hypothetical protein
MINSPIRPIDIDEVSPAGTVYPSPLATGISCNSFTPLEAKLIDRKLKDRKWLKGDPGY